MTVQQVMDALLNTVCGENRISPTCDILTSGDPNMEVTGVAVTFMATVEVIRKAIRGRANFIISHEPTWFNGKDEAVWCRNDRVYLSKKKLLDDHHIAVWRFHDHMHFGSPVDYIYKGLLDDMDWHRYLQPDEKEPWVYQIPETTLETLARTLKAKFQMQVIQTIGRPDTKVTRVGILVGGGSLGFGREMMPMEVMERNNLNVLICGDITEWTICAYINDAQQLGFERAMITLGHERSEESGMKFLVPWIKENVKELRDLPITFISAEEPFTYY